MLLSKLRGLAMCMTVALGALTGCGGTVDDVPVVTAEDVRSVEQELPMCYADGSCPPGYHCEGKTCMPNAGESCGSFTCPAGYYCCVIDDYCSRYC